MEIAPRRLVVALLISALLIVAPVCEAKRSLGGSNRKSSSGGGQTTRRQPTSVTKPTYNTNSGSSSGNSHADQAKLSYPNYNSQPNRPASAPAPGSNTQPIGWNVPNNQAGHAGPPPAYSASNVQGGAKTNMHEPPPVYQKPNYGAAPPSYNQATGTNYGQTYHPGAAPAGATYHSPNNLPPGATYYNNPSHVPGGYPAGGGYPSGGYPAGGYGGGGYHPGGGGYPQQAMPAGATYVPAGNALPPGAVFMSAPPQQSSGLGFGSGLAAGAIGGAILGHVLTPSQTRVVEHAPAAAAGGGGDSGHDRIIIINNGQPVNATTDANGATVINTGAPAAAAAAPVANADTPAQLAPMAPMPPATPDINVPQNATTDNTAVPMPAPAMADPNAPANPEQPPAGGIICVPMRLNETDPNDATKMIEVEKVACYPAPPPPPPAAANMDAANPQAAPAAPADGSVPLAPMQPVTAGSSSQQLQQQSTMVGDQSIKSADSAGFMETGSLGMITCFLLTYFIAN